jgi:YfiH family protein
MKSKLMSEFPELIVYFGNRSQDYESLEKGAEGIYVDEILITKTEMVMAEQVHSNKIYIATKRDTGAGFERDTIPGVDGLITREKNLFLTLRTADCVPVLIYDPIRKIVAAVHSGREGTKMNVVYKTIEIMIVNFNCVPSDLFVVTGPAICPEHYTVDRNTFEEFCIATKTQHEYPCLDIKKTINQQLLNAGVKGSNIENIYICTFENTDFFSYRRSSTNNRQITLIGMM